MNMMSNLLYRILNICSIKNTTQMKYSGKLNSNHAPIFADQVLVKLVLVVH